MLFHANLEEEERIDKNAEKNDDDQYESNMDSRSDDKECAEDQDFCDRKDSNQMSSCISMLAIFTITQCAIKSKKAFQETICLKTVPIVDQVVIAKTSKGESQGSAFVKVCWDLNMSIAYYRSVETGDKILEDPHAYK